MVVDTDKAAAGAGGGVMWQTELERTLETLWRQCGGPELEAEYRFHPTRKFRFDFAYIPLKIAIECEGGTYSGGRHVRGAGYAEDCVKYNQAALLGWRVFRLTADMLRDDPYGHLKPIAEMIAAEMKPVPAAGLFVNL